MGSVVRGEGLLVGAFATKANCKARENRVANGNKPILRRNTQPSPPPWFPVFSFPLSLGVLSTYFSGLAPCRTHPLTFVLAVAVSLPFAVPLFHGPFLSLSRSFYPYPSFCPSFFRVTVPVHIGPWMGWNHESPRSGDASNYASAVEKRSIVS